MKAIDLASKVADRFIQAAGKDADADFKAKMKVVRGQVKKLEDALDKEATKQAKDPKNWGYVGDLGHVDEVLTDLLSFFGG
jgi:hypothetical protein